MRNPMHSAEVPEPTGDGLTPHTYQETIMATDSDTPKGGFRVFVGRPGDDVEEKVFYVVESPKERYSVHIITPQACRRVTQDRWRAHIKPYSHRIRPAQKDRELAWAAYQQRGPQAVRSTLQRLQERHIDANGVGRVAA